MIATGLRIGLAGRSLVHSAVAARLHAVLPGNHLHEEAVEPRAHHVVRAHAPRLLALDWRAALLLADVAHLGESKRRVQKAVHPRGQPGRSAKSGAIFDVRTFAQARYIVAMNPLSFICTLFAR